MLVRAGLHDGGAAPAASGKAKNTTVARPAKTATPAERFYVVRAGDTLAEISGRTGIPVARLLQLNPKVEPTSLFIGDRIRLR